MSPDTLRTKIAAADLLNSDHNWQYHDIALALSVSPQLVEYWLAQWRLPLKAVDPEFAKAAGFDR